MITKTIKHMLNTYNPRYYKYDWLCYCKICRFLRLIKIKK